MFGSCCKIPITPTTGSECDRLVYVSYLKLCLKVPEVVEWTGHGRLYVAAPSLSGRSDFSIPTIFHPAIRHRKAACAGNVSSHRSEEHTSELQSLRHLVCR